MLANPYMLAALAAVTLPWIIEWLFRRRRRTIELPTIRFLLRTTEQRKVRLQDLIILAVRSLAIGLFVLALARPILRPGPLLASSRKSLDVLLIFDATYSNAQKAGPDMAFALARRMGSEVAAALPKGAKVTLATFSDRVNVEAEATDDLPGVRERIERLAPSDKAGQIAHAIEWAEEFIAARNLAPAEIYFFSDMQESTWKDCGLKSEIRNPKSEIVSRFARLCQHNRVFIADTGGGDIANYFLSRFEPTESLVTAGIPATFAATVEATNLAPGGTHRAELAFYVDGERQSTHSFTLGEQPHTLRLQHTFLHGGTYLLRAVLQGDSHTMDNTRYCLLAVPESHRVLVVDEGAGEKPLASGGGLLALAISPPRKPGRDKFSPFQATACTPEDFSRQNLALYDAVALANLSQLPPRLVGALEAFVAEGGALIVCLGDRVVPFEHNRRLYRQGRGLLPCAIAEAPAPFSAEFRLPLANPAPPWAAVQRHLPLELSPDDKGARVVARFGDGSPALVAKPFGRGRVLLFAGSAGPEWGELPLSERFPILIHELLRELLGNPHADVNLEVGGAFDQPVLLTSQHLVLKRPDGRRARLTPTKAEGQAVRRIRYEETDRAGVYEVDTIPEVLAKRRFVVNLAPAESDLRRLDPERFALAFGGAQATFLPEPSRVRRFVAERHSVREAAPGILMALFGLLAVESFLAFRFGRRRG